MMKKSSQYVILLIIGVFIFQYSYAQQWCQSVPTHLSKDLNLIAPLVKTQVTIPVVVHVVWRTEEERITEENIRAQIDILNEDFNALNADLDAVIPFYQQVVADMEIQFELVAIDVDGNDHSGINYRQTPIAGLGTTFYNGKRRVCYDEWGGVDAWCPRCYLNIWVVDLGLDGVSGIATFPEDVGITVPEEEDGVYIQPERFGRGEPPYHLGRTLTHEVGHYLNLLHPWGVELPPNDCLPSDCCDNPAYDDLVADTQSQIWTYASLCPSGAVSSCPPWPDNYQNFMGYANDECTIMFTEGQKNRVRASLQMFRYGLLSDDCIASCFVGVPEIESAMNKLFRRAYFLGETLVIETEVSKLDWKVYSATGQEVGTFRSDNVGSHVIDVNWRPGLYYLFAYKNQEQQVVKLMK